MNARLSLGYALAVSTLCFTQTAAAVDVTCHPAGVGENYRETFARGGVAVGAVAVQCKDAGLANTVFYVPRDDAAAAARFTSLALAALLSGRSLLLGYEPENALTPCEGRKCFWIHQWSIW